MISAKFQGYVTTEDTIRQLESLNDRQLDEFMVGMFNWQEPINMERWLSEIVSVN